MTTATLYYGEGLYGAGEYVDAISQGRETKAVNDGLRAVPAPFITGMKLKADVMLGSLVLNTLFGYAQTLKAGGVIQIQIFQTLHEVGAMVRMMLAAAGKHGSSRCQVYS